MPENDEIENINGVEISINEFQEDLVRRTTNLNQKEIDMANAELDEIQLTMKGHTYCNKCGKSLRHFELIWENQQNLNELKGLPRQERKRPFFVVNEKNGRGLHTYRKLENGKAMMIPFGNIDRACVPCNATLDRHNQIQLSDKEVPYTSKISIEKRGKCKTLWDNALVKCHEMCYEQSIQKFSGRGMLNCSQKMLREAFMQEYQVSNGYDLIKIDDFGIKCDYKDCTGEHIIQMNKPPQRVMTDYQAQESEEKQQQKQN